ncbi:GTP-binding protein 1-like [Daphnia pulicaria]|uniref:GTP-binding protein 1-like n=1 Tax=Daphnia pulicaria TaxID=35523 RepID=UPI001EEC4CD2|nr:GTP-binding protein 1-like [Daphnia pulicaria]
MQKLQYLIEMGNGEIILEVGVGEGEESELIEEDYRASVATLESIATTLEADCVVLRERTCECGIVGQYLIRHRADQEDFVEIRVAVIGNVDAGKSTLLGVLTHGDLDSGIVKVHLSSKQLRVFTTNYL